MGSMNVNILHDFYPKYKRVNVRLSVHHTVDIQVVFNPLVTLHQVVVYPKDSFVMKERKEVVYSIH